MPEWVTSIDVALGMLPAVLLLDVIIIAAVATVPAGNADRAQAKDTLPKHHGTFYLTSSSKLVQSPLQKLQAHLWAVHDDHKDDRASGLHHSATSIGVNKLTDDNTKQGGTVTTIDEPEGEPSQAKFFNKGSTEGSDSSLSVEVKQTQTGDMSTIFSQKSKNEASKGQGTRADMIDTFTITSRDVNAGHIKGKDSLIFGSFDKSSSEEYHKVSGDRSGKFLAANISNVKQGRLGTRQHPFSSADPHTTKNTRSSYSDRLFLESGNNSLFEQTDMGDQLKGAAQPRSIRSIENQSFSQPLAELAGLQLMDKLYTEPTNSTWDSNCTHCFLNLSAQIYDELCFDGGNLNCSSRCNCLNKSPCKADTGECLNNIACAYGWAKPDCRSSVCPDPLFAPYYDCMSVCQDGCESCHPLTGECQTMKPSDVCNQRNYFGQMCQNECHCYGGRVCHPVTGICPDNACAIPYSGKHCMRRYPLFFSKHTEVNLFLVIVFIFCLKAFLRLHFSNLIDM